MDFIVWIKVLCMYVCIIWWRLLTIYRISLNYILLRVVHIALFNCVLWIGYNKRFIIVCLSVCRLSVTFVHPTQAIEIFRNVYTPFGTLDIYWFRGKILLRSSQGNPSVGVLNRRGVARYSNFGPLQDYISETVQDRR